MTPETAREMIEQALLEVVPDADVENLRPDTDIREYLELDSLDFVTLVEKLSKRAGFRIDEEDYGELRTMDTASRFVVARAGQTV